MGKKQKTSAEPWKDIQPYLIDTANAGADLFSRGKLAPDPVGFGDVTRQGLAATSGLARNNAITAAASGTLGDFLGAPRFQMGDGYNSTLGDMSKGIQYGGVSGPQATNYGTLAQPGTPQFQAAQGPSSFDVASRLPDGPQSYGSIDPNFGIDAVRQNVLETTLPQIAGMFGTGGFSKSTAAQSAAGRAVASALAPYEFDQINRNRALDMQQFNAEQDRALNYGLASTGLEAGQFNVDEGRRLGFDVQQNAANLAQQNLNSDRLTDFGFNLRDRQVGQENLNDSERVAFDAQQHAAKLAQLNQNRDFRFAADDRLRDQYNTEENRAFDQFFNQNQQQLSALGLAPAINGLQYGDAQALLGVGQLRDQNRQDRANRSAEEVKAAASLFTQLGGLGGTQSQSPSALNTLGSLGQLGVNGALAYSLFGGGAAAGAGAGLAAGGAGASAGALLPLALCDRRLKRDITRVGTWRGVAIYTFRYLWDDVLRIGPMAQEVPERARVKVGDFYAVDMRAI